MSESQPTVGQGEIRSQALRYCALLSKGSTRWVCGCIPLQALCLLEMLRILRRLMLYVRAGEQVW